MAQFRSSGRSPRDGSWYNFPWKALSIASRLRVRWGRPETPRTWRRIVDYLHRSGFPAFDTEKLRLAVLDFEDRSGGYGEGPRTTGRNGVTIAPPEDIDQSGDEHPETSPPAIAAHRPTREDVDATWTEAWRQEFPDEEWPGIEKAIPLLQRKAREQASDPSSDQTPPVLSKGDGKSAPPE